VAFSGYLLSKIKKVPLITEIRDIWPESAYAVGMAKKNLFFRFMESLEKLVYRHSKKIIVNAEGIGRRLASGKNVPEEKIFFIPNGADLDMFGKNAGIAETDKKYGLAGKFVVLYTGLIGLAQSPEVMIEAAKILGDNGDVAFLIVGDGALRSKCEKLANDYGLKNVIFTGGRPREEMPALTQRADVAVIPYKNFELFKDVIPSKMYDYLAAGKPMIINIDGEGARIIRESRSGLVISPENPKELADAILKIKSGRKIAEKMGQNGQRYARENYDKKKIAKDLDRLLISANNLEESEAAGNQLS
jgi:glycosyltransferase involved in cell wall biosynthesis